MASVGVPIGAMNHCWYWILDRILPGVGGRIVAQKVLADQFIYGPFCLSTFFIGEKKASVLVIILQGNCILNVL